MPERRASGLLRVGPLLSDLGGTFVRIAAGVFQRLSHRGVHPHLPRLELRALRDLLRQRVLEGIFHLTDRQAQAREMQIAMPGSRKGSA